jgi:hypothetical protein
MTAAAVNPDDALVSARVAADLAGVPLPRVLSLVRAGSVRSERIKGALFVSLSDVDHAARDVAGKGAGHDATL